MDPTRDNNKLSDQSKNHIIDYSNRNNPNSTNSKESSSFVRPDMHQKVMSFERRLQYDNLVKAGTSPREAARRVGVNVPMGANLTPKDITQILETGKLHRRSI